jgi:D-alanyl-D-alanine carboxypeptidase/D-alanyl-D-alanine-endopeptidase (penicillin-binding protein 4)
VPVEGVRSFDGSGLSRYDGLSADALVAILRAVWDRPHLRDTFISTLPQAGESGTLASRMTAGPARSRVRAKTGSMFNVRTLAGYVTTASGDTLAVAFMANGFLQRSTEVDALSDEILALLAR